MGSHKGERQKHLNTVTPKSIKTAFHLNEKIFDGVLKIAYGNINAGKNAKVLNSSSNMLFQSSNSLKL